MPPTLMVGNLEAQRDLSDVRDTVRAYRALMASGRAGTCYNVCSGAAVSMQAVLDGLRAHVRVPVTVAQDPARMRPADTPVVLGDRSRLTADTGWQPELLARRRRSPIWSSTGAAKRAAKPAERVARRRLGPDLDEANKKRNSATAMHDRLSRDLFDFAPPPTTRDVARLVKAGGVAALPDAVTRADDATYQEIRCRSALNRVAAACRSSSGRSIPIAAARTAATTASRAATSTQLELGAGDDFASVIFVKTNIVEVLRRELARPSRPRRAGGDRHRHRPVSADRRHLRPHARAASRRSATAPWPIGIVTKGPMVVRDIDVLRELSAPTRVRVYLSVPSLDDDAWRRLEPGTAPPLQRLRAVRALVDAGIHCGVLMAPLVPGITTRPSLSRRRSRPPPTTARRSVGAMVLHLDGGTRTPLPARARRRVSAPGRGLRTAVREEVRAGQPTPARSAASSGCSRPATAWRRLRAAAEAPAGRHGGAAVVSLARQHAGRRAGAAPR